MGKNSVSKVPHEIAALLNLPDPSKYTFHSFRRTSATRAADAGATTEQLVDFFGWKNASMCQEYISSSRPAVVGMANRLSGSGVNTQVEPRIDDIGGGGVTGLGDLSQTQPQQEDNMDTIIAEMEEDEDMFQEAGIPTKTVFKDKATGQQGVVEASIRQTISALPVAKGANIKVIVVNNMSGNINL